MTTKPNDDPVLAMCTLWQRDCDQLDELVVHASRCEFAKFRTPASERDEAVRAAEVAIRARDRLFHRLDVRARAIFASEARSLEGAAAKLAVAIRDGETKPDDPLPPWSWMRSVRADLDRFSAVAGTTPIA